MLAGPFLALAAATAAFAKIGRASRIRRADGPAREQAGVAVVPLPRAPAPAPPRPRRTRTALALAASLLTAALVGLGAAALVQAGDADAPAPAPDDVVLRAPDGLGGVARTAQWVEDENDKPGTAAWRLSDGHRRGIEGFADSVSAQQGDAVTIYASTAASTFTVSAFRMGWYDGDGGRLVWRSEDIEAEQQSPPLLEPGTGMAEAEWAPSLTVRITSEFPAGAYLFKLVSDAGDEHRIPLVVRDDDSRAAYLVQSGVMAWQARNPWGARSSVVSFDRPYAGSDFVTDELPFVSMAESMGLDVAYTTDVDVHRRPDLVSRHRALIVLGVGGHWTTDMCEAAAGERVAFASPGSSLRVVRLENSPLGLYRRQTPVSDPSCNAVRAVYAAPAGEPWPDRLSAMLRALAA